MRPWCIDSVPAGSAGAAIQESGTPLTRSVKQCDPAKHAATPPVCHCLTRSVKQCELPRAFRLAAALLECGRGASIPFPQAQPGPPFKRVAHRSRTASSLGTLPLQADPRRSHRAAVLIHRVRLGSATYESVLCA